jgi:hypothetical protein
MPAWSAEGVATNVPDPYGLGERLALVDWLQEHGQRIQDASDVEGMRKVYLKATALPEDPLLADRIAELKRLIWTRHTLNTEGRDPVKLEELLRELDADAKTKQDAERVIQVARLARDHDVAAPQSSRKPSDPGIPEILQITIPSPRSRATEAAQKMQPPGSIPSVDAFGEWVNFASASLDTRSDLSVTCYIRQGDEWGYYVLFTDRQAPRPSPNEDVRGRYVRFQINGTTFRMNAIMNGERIPCRLERPADVSYSISPTVSIQAINDGY